MVCENTEYFFYFLAQTIGQTLLNTKNAFNYLDQLPNEVCTKHMMQV